MKKYGIVIKAKDGLNAYKNIRKIIKLLYGKILLYKVINNQVYKIDIEVNSAAFRLITKLTLKSKNIKQVYITQIP